MSQKYTTILEDYNVPFYPWYILHDDVLSRRLDRLSDGALSMDAVFVWKKDHIKWGVNDKKFSQGGIYVQQMLEKDPKFIEKILKNTFARIKDIERFNASLQKKDLSRCSNKVLFGIYKKAYDLFSECWTWGMFGQFLEMGSDKYSTRVKAHVMPYLRSFKNPEEVYAKAITPLGKTLTYKEQRAILKLAVKVKKDLRSVGAVRKKEYKLLSMSMKRSIMALVRQYGWLQTYYMDIGAGKEYYVDVLGRYMHKDPSVQEKRYIREEGSLRELDKKIQKILPRGVYKEIQILRDLAYAKECRKEYQQYQLSYVMGAWFREIGRRFYWTSVQARYITLAEYGELLIDGRSLIDESVLNSRYAFTVYTLKGKKTQLITGQQGKRIEKMFVVEKDTSLEKVTELRGDVAYAGIARGKVKLINRSRDVVKMQEGDVLVSYSTNPTLMLAIHRASAIVTNTGGVTCHAAIVSRELKKPCIIGTKIATKVLKDGMMVEVDANTGVVRVLEE